MVFDITNYKLKHIVSLNPDFIKNLKINLDIDGKEYEFKFDEVKSTIIEFVHYFKYNEINSELGPVEIKLKNHTYGKTFNEFEDKELYELRNNTIINVDIDGNQYELEVTGAGPVALRVCLYLTYNQIETSKNNLETQLNSYIRNTYSQLIEKNNNYQNKLIEKTEEEKAEEEKQAKIREEIRREEEEKERKRKKLEEFLNSNKSTTDNKPFRY